MTEHTRSVEQLRDEMEHVVSEIDERLLLAASPEAREEWELVRTHWRDDFVARRVVDDELAFVVTKVRRFGDILRARGNTTAGGRTATGGSI